MMRDGRLSFALHALLHLAQHPERTMTSGELAACSGAHPVVIRQTFAGLREAGIVASRHGRGGGWRLARPACEITLDQVQRALGERLVAIDAADAGADCVVERSVHHALNGALEEAARVLDHRLAATTLADLAGDARRLAGAASSLSRGASDEA